MKSSHAGIIQNLPDVSKSKKTAQVCPSNNNISLISLGKLCDDGCEAIINKRVCKVCEEKKNMLTAPHCSHGGMHVMNLKNPNPKNLVNASLANKQHELVNTQIL